MAGIVDAPGFRERVLAQRDLVVGDGSKRNDDPDGENVVSVLKEIRDSLKKIEERGI